LVAVLAKVLDSPADLRLMISSISSSEASQASEAAKPAAPKPQPQQQSAPQPADKVTLKSTGDVDSDGDSK
jgi:hypothetical protein